MGILVLALLVAAWGLVLGPSLLRNAHQPSPIRSEMMFKRALKALDRPGRPREASRGRWVMVPRISDYPVKEGDPARRRSGGGARRRAAAERRRRNMSALSVFVIVTFFAGLLPPLRLLLWPCLVASVLLIAYVVAALIFAARPVAVRAPRIESTDMRPPEVAGGGL